MYMDKFNINNYEKWRKIDYKYPMLFKPCPILEEYVSCYWLSIYTGTKENAIKLKPKAVTLIPDGGSSIIFDINYRQNRHNESIWGVMDKPVVVYNQHSISQGETMTFGVDFKPGGLCRFLSIPMRELANKSPELSAISHSTFYPLTESMVNAKSIGEQIQIIEAFLLRQISKADGCRASVAEALHSINETCGNIRVSELADRLMISERSLRRLFNDYVGMPPKTLCRLTRLQNAMRNCREGEETDFLMAAYDSGYFDQAHFIKDFKEFCGCTPGKYKKL